jgi:hypothetical protein
MSIVFIVSRMWSASYFEVNSHKAAICYPNTGKSRPRNGNRTTLHLEPPGRKAAFYGRMRNLARVVVCLGVGLIMLGFVPSVRANLIVNGSFEQVGPSADPASTFTTDYAPISTNTLTGWTSAVGTEPSAANYLSTAGSSAAWIPDPFDGNYSVQLDSSTNTSPYSSSNSLSQTVNLTANVVYHLSFYMSAEAARGLATTSTLDLILNGGGFSNFTNEFQASRTGTDTKATTAQWFLQTLDFTPTSSGAVTLTFQDIFTVNGTSSNSSIDNVILIAVTPEVPNGLVVAAVCAASILWHYRRRTSAPLRR